MIENIINPVSIALTLFVFACVCVVVSSCEETTHNSLDSVEGLISSNFAEYFEQLNQLLYAAAANRELLPEGGGEDQEESGITKSKVSGLSHRQERGEVVHGRELLPTSSMSEIEVEVTGAELVDLRTGVLVQDSAILEAGPATILVENQLDQQSNNDTKEQSKHTKKQAEEATR